MKILHTSDWHIGRTLCGRKRYEEFEAFLIWLEETLHQEQVDTGSYPVLRPLPAAMLW